MPMSCIFKQPAFSHSIAGHRANQNKVLPAAVNAILPRSTSPGDATEHYGIVSLNGAAPSESGGDLMGGTKPV